jgi:hypothetical protein
MPKPNYDGAGNPYTAGSAFPTSTIDCDYPHTATVEFKNAVVVSYGGKEKRSAMVPARKIFTLRFEQLTHADADVLWNHYLAQSGTLESFSYQDYNEDPTNYPPSYTVRYQNESLSRESFIYDAERVGITLIEVL